jgi:hypothetical protein
MVLSSGVRVVHYLSFLCCVCVFVVNLFSMLSVSSPMVLSSGVRVVYFVLLFVLVLCYGVRYYFRIKTTFGSSVVCRRDYI